MVMGATLSPAAPAAPADAPGHRLVALDALARASVSRSFLRLWTSPQLEQLFPRYLTLMHWVIRSSVPLMEFAVSNLSGEPETWEFPYGPEVRELVSEYLTRHIHEERSHDEWLLEDLERLGVARSSVIAERPSRAVAELVGAQYYWIAHHDPVLLLGYIFALEANSPSAGLIDHLQSWGLDSAGALSTLREHSELDGDHTADLVAVLNRIPVALADGLGANLLATLDRLSRALDELLSNGGSRC